MKQFKERISYIKDITDSGKIVYCGFPVNISGITLQADSLEELQEKAKKVCKWWLKWMLEGLEQDEPFELKEETTLIEWLHSNDGRREKEQLARYKEKYGEL